jgi:type IV pilus assembly protein PilP
MRKKAVWCAGRIRSGQLVALLTAIVCLAGARSSAAQAVPLQPGPAASAPKPPAPIAAARDVAGKVDAAHQKNAEALDPNPAPPAPAPGAAPANTQAATAKPTNQPTSPTQAAAGGAAAPTAPPYTYEPNGRRDPFVSLLFRGGETHPTGATRAPGLPGQLVGELNLKGILKSKGGYIAILQGSDNKTYIGRPGDRVMDGSIKSIVPDAVVFSQDVNDPLSLVKQREVRKAIRPETK